jgi:hypothetical protein
MAHKTFKHRLVHHHLPGLRSALMGIALAVLVLIVAFGCPMQGLGVAECGGGISLIVILMMLFLPFQIRHLWHTIEHYDLLYYLLAGAVSVATLFYLPATWIVRIASAVAVFAVLTMLKWFINKKFKWTYR